MKTIIYSTLALIICATTFVGCTKEENADYEKDIVGTWQLSRYWRLDDFMGEYYDLYEEYPDVYEEEWERFTFRNNGTGVFSWWDIDRSKAVEEAVRYKIVNNEIHLQIYDAGYEEWHESVYQIEVISTKKMVWIDEDKDKSEFKKIK